MEQRQWVERSLVTARQHQKTKLPTASGLSKLMNLLDPGLNIWKWAGTRPASRNQFQDLLIGHVLYAAEIGHYH